MKTENLTQYSARELEIAAKAIQAHYSLNDSVDERYLVEWKILKVGETITIVCGWCSGEVPASGNDPQTMIDREPVIKSHHIILLESNTLTDFAKEVFEALSMVTSNEYDVIDFYKWAM